MIPSAATPFTAGVDNPKFAVYFLISGGSVVYVGSSIRLASRIRQHRSNYVEFDAVMFLALDDRKRMLEVEAEYISSIQPPLNGELHSASAESERQLKHAFSHDIALLCAKLDILTAKFDAEHCAGKPGLTQREFAKLMRKHPRTVNRWIAEKKLRLEKGLIPNSEVRKYLS